MNRNRWMYSRLLLWVSGRHCTLQPDCKSGWGSPDSRSFHRQNPKWTDRLHSAMKVCSYSTKPHLHWCCWPYPRWIQPYKPHCWMLPPKCRKRCMYPQSNNMCMYQNWYTYAEVWRHNWCFHHQNPRNEKNWQIRCKTMKSQMSWMPVYSVKPKQKNYNLCSHIER